MTGLQIGLGRSLTGAWIETSETSPNTSSALGRSLTGAWIETIYDNLVLQLEEVAPSRGRGLKQEL